MDLNVLIERVSKEKDFQASVQILVQGIATEIRSRRDSKADLDLLAASLEANTGTLSHAAISGTTVTIPTPGSEKAPEAVKQVDESQYKQDKAKEDKENELTKQNVARHLSAPASGVRKGSI